jgi:G3E family GTPase
VKKIQDLIHQFHPEPLFYETTFADIPFDRFFFPEVPSPSPSPSEVGLRPVMSSEELEKYIDELLDNPALEITPPDRLVSVSYHWSGEDLEEVRSLAQSLPNAVLRAKGFVEEEGMIYLFSYVMGDWTIEPSKIPKDRIRQKNVLVFIGPPESMEGIDEASKQGNWWNMGVFQPMSQNST